MINFDPVVYANVFRTYSVLDAHLLSMETQKMKKQQLEATPRTPAKEEEKEEDEEVKKLVKKKPAKKASQDSASEGIGRAVGSQLKAAGGMFSAFKEEFDKARRDD